MDIITDLLHYYKFDEGNGSVGADEIDNKDFNITNTGLWTPSGKINSGLSWETINTSIYTPNFTKPSMPYTIGFWAYIPPTVTETYVIHVSLGGVLALDNSYRGLAVVVNSVKRINLFLFDSNPFSAPGNRRSYSSNVVLTDGWNYITAVVEGIGSSDNKLYINGNEDTTFAYTSGTGGPISYTNEGFRIGQFLQSSYENSCGRIDELALWGRELTPLEVQHLYNSGSGLQYPFGLLSPYKIWDGSTWQPTTLKIYNGTLWIDINAYNIKE